jgi:hypothetical protein
MGDWQQQGGEAWQQGSQYSAGSQANGGWNSGGSSWNSWSNSGWNSQDAARIDYSKDYNNDYHQSYNKDYSQDYSAQKSYGQDYSAQPQVQYCGTELPGVPPPPPPKGKAINFGVRGDSLLNTRQDKGKNSKRYRTFQESFEVAFGKAFGDITMDYQLNAGQKVRDITNKISQGPKFDILCVGIQILDFFTEDFKKSLLIHYPEHLDVDLVELAEAILAKGNGHLVVCGGPADVWKYPVRWDGFMERAGNTLRRAGLQVVPLEQAGEVMAQMEIGSDYTHFANTEQCKEVFANAWASWLLAAAADKTFGRTITDGDNTALPPAPPQAGAPQSGQRPRSRSARRGKFSSSPEESQIGSLSGLMKTGFGAPASAPPQPQAAPMWDKQQVLSYMTPVLREALTTLHPSQQYGHVFNKMEQVKHHVTQELYMETLDAVKDALASAAE